MMPSGRPSTSIVLITCNVFESHIVIGLVVEKPWWDLGSTVAPPEWIVGIEPAGSSVSRLKTMSWPIGPLRGMYNDARGRPRRCSQNRLRRRPWRSSAPCKDLRSTRPRQADERLHCDARSE